MNEAELERIEKKLAEQIMNSTHNVVEDERGNFRKNNKKVWLDIKRSEITVKPVDYYYTSLKEVFEYEYELKGAVDDYFRRGLKAQRLTFEEKRKNERSILYCKMIGAGISIEFRPKWFEILNGANRMVFTEYKNAKIRNKDIMLNILKDLRKITKRAENHCLKLGYKV